MSRTHTEIDAFKRIRPYTTEPITREKLMEMDQAHLRLLFCTRMKSQSTMARTPVLSSRR